MRPDYARDAPQCGIILLAERLRLRRCRRLIEAFVQGWSIGVLPRRPGRRTRNSDRKVCHRDVSARPPHARKVRMPICRAWCGTGRRFLWGVSRSIDEKAFGAEYLRSARPLREDNHEDDDSA